MRLSQFFLHAYRLKPLGHREADALAEIRIGKERVLAPFSLALSYIVVPANGAGLPIESADFRVEPLGALASLWARVRLMMLFKKKKYLEYDEFRLFCAGPRLERKRFTRFNQDTADIGFVIDGDLIAKHPALLRGWPAEAGPPRRAADRRGPVTVAVVAHAYYEDAWPDIAGALRGLTVPFDLIVTTVKGRERLIETIRQAYPHAQIEVIENRGRDIGPFLALLERGRLDAYRYVCKIHGKKSSDGGRKAYMGAMWRRRLLFDLLGAPGAADAAIAMFERDPSIGMIGPRVFRLPREGYGEDLSWASNRAMTLEIAGRMGVAETFKLDFFGGSMFWVRPEALKPLRDLHLAAEMPDESGMVDGSLPHAIERVASAAVVAAGYRLADCDGGEAQAGE